MPRFRVLLQGAPVFLDHVESQNTKRLGFYTTRWVRATSSDEAEVLACRMVIDEFVATGTRNPPDQPIRVVAKELVEVSWLEAVRRGPGRGFSFYPDDVS